MMQLKIQMAANRYHINTSFHFYSFLTVTVMNLVQNLHQMYRTKTKNKQYDALRRYIFRFLFLTGCINERLVATLPPFTACLIFCALIVLSAQTSVFTSHQLCSVTGTVSICRYSNMYNLIISWHVQQHCLIKTIGSSDTSKTTQTSFSIFSRQFSCNLYSFCGLIFSQQRTMCTRKHAKTSAHKHTHAES